jgi:hypothetical protein
MSDRQKENIGNLKKLRAMIKKDMNTVAQVNKVQDKIEGMTTAGKKALSSEIADFKKLRKNVLAREEPKFRDSSPRGGKVPQKEGTMGRAGLRKAMAPKEGGPKTPTKLPKPKPKKEKEPSGVTFDTSGTLPGQTIKKSAMGRAVMKKRGGTFKGIF